LGVLARAPSFVILYDANKFSWGANASVIYIEVLARDLSIYNMEQPKAKIYFLYCIEYTFLDLIGYFLKNAWSLPLFATKKRNQFLFSNYFIFNVF
jgi:hypothetical protein